MVEAKLPVGVYYCIMFLEAIAKSRRKVRSEKIAEGLKSEQSAATFRLLLELTRSFLPGPARM